MPFRSIATVAPFISAMNKLAEQNLAERSPSKWVEWLFHSHPAISRRVAAAQAWASLLKRGQCRRERPARADYSCLDSSWRNFLDNFTANLASPDSLPHERDARAYIDCRIFFHAPQIFFRIHSDSVMREFELRGSEFRFPGSATAPAARCARVTTRASDTKLSSADFR